MPEKHTQNARFVRIHGATFAEHPGRPEMLAFGIDGDPREPLAAQVVISPGYTVNHYFRGGGELIDHNGRQRIEAGSVVLRIPHVEQRLTHDRSPRYAKAWLGCSTHKGEALVALGLLSHGRTCWRCSDSERALYLHNRLLDDCIGGLKPVGAQLWRRIIEWLEALHPARTAVVDPIGRAAELLLGDLSGRQDLRHIAQRAEIPYGTLRRRFQERFGLPPAAWRLRERMRRACALLADHSVGAVAAQLGYNSPFAFSSQFHRSIGMSPRDWQRRIRG